MAGSNEEKLVPSFLIYINGSRLAVEKEADIKEITVINKLDAPSSFSITVSDMKKKWMDNNDNMPGSEVKISLGYKDKLEEIFKGEITAISPMFRLRSDTILVIKGHDQLHRLTRAKKSRSFSGNKKDSDIIKEIAGDAGLSSDIDNIGAAHLFTMQRNQTDYDYIMDIANRYNCKVWVKDKKLYFKKLQENSGEDVVLEWGKTLIEFNPNLDTTKLISEAEVRGWDKDKAEAVVGTKKVSNITLKIGGNKLGGAVVEEKFGAAKMIHIDENIKDKSSADQAALDILTENSMNYITASGKT